MLFLVVSNIKDINFWKQFTTYAKNHSQELRCFEYQRYKLLKAIHNPAPTWTPKLKVVSNIKDINFWKQFTTVRRGEANFKRCFEYQRYKLLKAIHNSLGVLSSNSFVVSNIKDINFWKQFTTCGYRYVLWWLLFRISKI